MSRKERGPLLKKLQDLTDIYQQEQGKNVWERILRYTERSRHKSDKEKFIDMGYISVVYVKFCQGPQETVLTHG